MRWEMDRIRRNFSRFAVLWRHPRGWRLQLGRPDFTDTVTSYHKDYDEAIKAIELSGDPTYVELPDYSSDIILNINREES